MGFRYSVIDWQRSGDAAQKRILARDFTARINNVCMLMMNEIKTSSPNKYVRLFEQRMHVLFVINTKSDEPAYRYK